MADDGAHHDFEQIQVVVDCPPPDNVVSRGAGGAENTLLLLNVLKEMKIKEYEKIKVCCYTI